ncbi:hypothetical protein BC831DRAFT_441007 [Entophlyctis helioformis]|nr:hypothetical protein BC831DRAFT_441007 [Entophlyctis helioformis]
MASPLSPSARHNVLVTGGAGFIGSHVAIRLANECPDYNVYVFDKLEYCASLKNLAQLANHPNYAFIKGDVCSAEFVNYILTDKRIDAILHLAAQSHVDNSFGDSLDFTRNNVLGTHVLLEAARVHNIKRFIHISTDEVYGEAHRGQPEMHETAILAPSNPYAATKAAAECLVMAYHKSFKLPIIITRSNNIYGPHQYPEKIIPKFICSILRGKPCFIHGDGSNSRRYLFVTDLAEAILLIMHRGTIGETYNIGSDFEISNLALAKHLLRHFGLGEDPEGKHTVFVEDRAFNDKRYAIDSTKIHELGWRPKVSFTEGMKQTVEWYRANSDTWWDDISSALVAHPGRKFPPLLFPEPANTFDEASTALDLN